MSANNAMPHRINEVLHLRIKITAFLRTQTPSSVTEITETNLSEM